MLSHALRQALDRHPAAKAAAKALLAPFRRSTSSDYRALPDDERAGTARALGDAWKHDDIPRQQRIGVDQSLAQYRAGVAMPAFDAFVELLGPLAASRPGQTLLEVGCSSGYYAEVLAIRGLALDYRGCDYSPAFVALARQCHPTHRFDVADATALPYGDGEFDIVVSGCCLLHIPDYGKAIDETARVARRYALFHKTPVLHTRATQYFTKLAYGVKTVEIHFQESELVERMARAGLRVVGIRTLQADWRQGDAFAMKSYLCEKQAA